MRALRVSAWALPCMAGAPFFDLGAEAIDTTAHQQLAYEAAQQTVVLLKNEQGTLPFKAGGKVAVVGPHFNATEALISNYHGSRCVDAPPPSGPAVAVTHVPQRRMASRCAGNMACSTACPQQHAK